MRDEQVGAPPHVVMAVASGIARDARVRKTALAVADAGYRVTLLWGDHEGSAIIEGTLGPVRTVGLPVPYLLRDARTARLARRRAWRPPWPGYRHGAALRTAETRLRAGSARIEGASVLSRAWLKARRFSHRARGRVFALQERGFARLWRGCDSRRHRRLAAGRHVPWERELANVADLEAAFTKWLWRLEPDALHIHDIHLLGAGVSAKRRLARAGRRVPMVYDAHEYVPGMTGGDPFVEAAYQQMEADLISEADAVITVSEPIADAIADRYRLRTRPTVVLNTPSLNPARQKTSPGAEASGPSDVRAVADVGDALLMVYSGVLGRLRNVETVIRALAYIDGVHFAAVCVPNAHYPVARALLTVAAKAGVADRVHLVEPVAPEEIIDFLATADLGVHPMVTGLANHEMALPNKLFDYVYAGLPVVVSDVAEMRRFVDEHAVGRTFDPDDPTDLARAVREALADLPALRAAVAAPGLRERYSWEVQAAEVVALYGTPAVLGNAGAPG